MNRVVKMIGYFRTTRSHCFFNKVLVLYVGRDGIHTPTYAQLQALLSETPPKFRSNGLSPGQPPKTIEACSTPSHPPPNVPRASSHQTLCSVEERTSARFGSLEGAKSSCKEGNCHMWRSASERTLQSL